MALYCVVVVGPASVMAGPRLESGILLLSPACVRVTPQFGSPRVWRSPLSPHLTSPSHVTHFHSPHFTHPPLTILTTHSPHLRLCSFRFGSRPPAPRGGVRSDRVRVVEQRSGRVRAVVLCVAECEPQDRPAVCEPWAPPFRFPPPGRVRAVPSHSPGGVVGGGVCAVGGVTDRLSPECLQQWFSLLLARSQESSGATTTREVCALGLGN
jgi:hypothetical protein